MAGILGTVTLDGSDRSNVCTLSFETAGGERFSYKENLTASLHEPCPRAVIRWISP